MRMSAGRDMDLTPKQCTSSYQAFVSDLLEGGLLGFTCAPQEIITPFFATKKNGKQRLVWDCQGGDRRFSASVPMRFAGKLSNTGGFRSVQGPI